MRIIADHVKASIMILNEKITPSNTERGYVLRRLIRRAIRYGRELGLNSITKVAEPVFKIYPDYNLEKNRDFILNELKKEEEQFSKTLKKGLKEFEKIVENLKGKIISGKQAFLLYQSYGFPLEITRELANEQGLEVDKEEFEKEEKEHKKKSRGEKFKSGLADSSEETKKLHTATHLLLAALKKFIDKKIQQKGSNITPERLRFDFNFERRLNEEEVEEIENWINKIISKGLKIEREEMSLEKARESKAEGVFNEKYGEKVSVYTIKDGKKLISREICAGPHASNTKELGEFKIYKQESPGKGLRRIKAKLT